MPEPTVGKEMAEKVAKRLRMKCDLAYDHRDYCGTGLTWYNGSYIYGRVWDGLVSDPIKKFEQEHEFIEWLAGQTNQSLDGHDEKDAFYKNNQRLTLTRLFEFVNSKPTPRFEN